MARVRYPFGNLPFVCRHGKVEVGQGFTLAEMMHLTWVAREWSVSVTATNLRCSGKIVFSDDPRDNGQTGVFKADALSATATIAAPVHRKVPAASFGPLVREEEVCVGAPVYYHVTGGSEGVGVEASPGGGMVFEGDQPNPLGSGYGAYVLGGATYDPATRLYLPDVGDIHIQANVQCRNKFYSDDSSRDLYGFLLRAGTQYGYVIGQGNTQMGYAYTDPAMDLPVTFCGKSMGAVKGGVSAALQNVYPARPGTGFLDLAVASVSIDIRPKSYWEYRGRWPKDNGAGATGFYEDVPLYHADTGERAINPATGVQFTWKEIVTAPWP